MMFKSLFYKVLEEDMTAGAGGALGDYESTGGALQATDTYNKGDHRIVPYMKKKKRKVKENIPVARRAFPETIILRRSLTNNRINTSRM